MTQLARGASDDDGSRRHGESSAWPLVGRDGALAELLGHVDRLADGHGSVVEITAEAGSGKTYLLGHVAALVASDPRVRVRSVQASSHDLVPFGCIRDLLDAPRSALPHRRSIIEAGVDSPGLRATADELFDRADTLAASERTMWIVDDAHLCDPASADWLRRFAAQRPLPVLLVLAGRPGRERLAPDDASTIALPPLDRDDVERLALHRDVDIDPAWVVDRSAGSPLLATALIELERRPDAGPRTDLELGRTPGSLASPASDSAADVPAAIAALVELAAHGHEPAVAAAAVLGERFDLADVAAVTGTSIVEVDSALRSLLSAGLVTPSGRRFAFRHELVRSAARSLVSGPMLAALHGRVAERLIERGDQPLRVAEHLLASSAEGSRASEWLVRAAAELVDLDPATAHSLIGHAIEAAPTPGRAAARVQARALANLGREREAEAAVRLLLPTAEPDERPGLHRDLAVIAFMRGAPAEAAGQFAAAIESCEDERAAARLRAESAFAHLLAGDFPAATAVAEQGSADGERLGDPVTVVAAEMVGALLALYRLDTATAVELADRLETLSAQPGVEEAVVYQPWFSASLVRRVVGDLDGSERLNAIGRHRSTETGYTWMVPAYDAMDAYCALDRGAFGDCAASATAALAAEVEDSFGASLMCEAFLARVAVAQGDDVLARHHVDAAERRLHPGRAQLGWDHVVVARAATADVGEAVQVLGEAWDVFVAFGLDSPRLELAWPLACAASRAGDHDRLAAVADDMERAASVTGEDTWRSTAAEIGALRRSDPDGLAEAAEHRSARGHHLRAGELLIEAARIAPTTERLRAATDAARGLDAPGLLRPLAGVIPTGGAAGTRARRPRLTPSETAVVELVAEGLSNAEIATRLFVSRRTVESHVSSAYRKLGASNRVELARHVLDR